MRGETGNYITRQATQELLYDTTKRSLRSYDAVGLVGAVHDTVAIINQGRRSWDYLKETSRLSWGVWRPINTCQHISTVVFNATYDRPLGKPNRVFAVRAAVQMVDASCEHWARLIRPAEVERQAMRRASAISWPLNGHALGTDLQEAPFPGDGSRLQVLSHTNPVHAVVIVKNCFPYLQRLTKILARLHWADVQSTSGSAGGGLVLHLGYFESDDGAYEELLKKQTFPCHLYPLGDQFSRSIGIHTVVEHLIAGGMATHHSLLLLLDTSAVLSEDVINSHDGSGWLRQVRRGAVQGVSAFAPVFFKFLVTTELKALSFKPFKHLPGNWAWTGYGNLAMCVSDYLAIGGMDKRWGHRWGAEDIDLVVRLRQRVLLVRTAEWGVFHVRDTSSRNQTYYSKPNMYTGTIPATPLSAYLLSTSPACVALHAAALAWHPELRTCTFKEAVHLLGEPGEKDHFMLFFSCGSRAEEEVLFHVTNGLTAVLRELIVTPSTRR